MRLAVNNGFGGFHLSEEAQKLYQQRTGKEIGYNPSFTDRGNKDLIQVIKDLGKEANGTPFSHIAVVTIPDHSYWIITEYDGLETVYYSESEIKIK